MIAASLAKLVVFAPLIGFLLSICFLNYARFVQVITCTAVTVAFLATIILWLIIYPDQFLRVELFPWLVIDSLTVNWGIMFDQTNFLMVAMVSFISLLVHIYSVPYMAQDANRALYMSYLNLFTFAMLFLLTSLTLIQLFVGWEGVGLVSYLLIGFWQHKPRAAKAANKAFVVNRIGDACLLLGICLLFNCCNTLDFSLIAVNIPLAKSSSLEFLGMPIATLNLAGILILLGSFSKSAQIGFHVWLADAMEAPTPVSALIHAATMVTAGIFIIIKLSVLFEALAYIKVVMITVGSATALMAAFFALSQTDIKKVIAYSTCSQLGYMVLACGCSAYGAALFHLITHAFFKSLLFLGAGSVIHAMSGEQDIKKMGGLAKLIPYTYYLMTIGSLALAGIPLFSGYYSKDLIIQSLAVNASNSKGITAALLVILVAVFLTAFYSWRLLSLVFKGTLRTNEQVAAHIHEAPPLMMIPLVILAIGSVFSGWIGFNWFFEHKENIPHVGPWLEFMVLVLSTVGAASAYWLYKINDDLQIIKKSNFLYKLSFNRGYFDEIYGYIFKTPLLKLGQFFYRVVDSKIIDDLGIGSVVNFVMQLSNKCENLQTANLSRYIFITIMSISVILIFYLLLSLLGPSLFKLMA